MRLRSAFEAEVRAAQASAAARWAAEDEGLLERQRQEADAVRSATEEPETDSNRAATANEIPNTFEHTSSGIGDSEHHDSLSDID